MGRLVLAVPLVAIAAVFAGDDARPDRIGQKFDHAVLTDLDGKPFPVKSLSDRAAIVVAFLSFDCPVSNNYASQLSDLSKQYASKRVGFIAVAPGDDAPADLRKRADEFKLAFPLYRDPKRDVTTAFKAKITPEVFVLDADLRLRYRGRIDDGYTARLKKNPQPKTNDLRDALEDVLAGRTVKAPVTQPIGCPIDVPQAVAANSAVTYHRDIEPILQKNCQSCHRPGEVGPFALMTYQQAAKWASDIKEYTQSRQMPPWMPHGGPAYANDRKLTDAEIATLGKWVDAGAPQGDPKDAPKPVQFTDGWKRGTPDLILSASEPFHLGATGNDIFRCFVIPTGLTENKWVVGLEVRPGNPRIVHHTLNFFDTTGKGRELQDQEQKRGKDAKSKDYGPGYSVGMGVGFIAPQSSAGEVPKFGGMGGWAPGQLGQFLPEGCGWLLPKGADFIIQTHYHRDGREQDDRTQIGLYFAKKPIDQKWQNVVINGLRGLTIIPAGRSDFVSKGAVYLHTDAVLHSVMPHMHLIGKTVKVTMTPPGAEPQVLVDIPHWEYNWQETYWFKEPIHAKAGTKLEIEAVYDNSTANPNNPRNPPVPVFFGEQTTNEMLFGFLGVTSTKSPWQRVVYRSSPPS